MTCLVSASLSLPSVVAPACLVCNRIAARGIEPSHGALQPRRTRVQVRAGLRNVRVAQHPAHLMNLEPGFEHCPPKPEIVESKSSTSAFWQAFSQARFVLATARRVRRTDTCRPRIPCRPGLFLLSSTGAASTRSLIDAPAEDRLCVPAQNKNR